MNTDKVIDDAREKIILEFRPFHPSCMMCGLEGECFANDEKLGNKKGEYRRNPLLCVAAQKDADQILALSGTTDIECPKCKGGNWQHPTLGELHSCECPKCNGQPSNYKWKVGVTLENGELPDMSICPNHNYRYTGKNCTICILRQREWAGQESMLNAGYRQVVE